LRSNRPCFQHRALARTRDKRQSNENVEKQKKELVEGLEVAEMRGNYKKKERMHMKLAEVELRIAQL